uniref:G_PROTEIN_RECEP_F1_2 domain-containing protein n=1 Tax=Panagrellus redivivus TaxID=6233 RepID=A0A7E4V9B6_PANRE
MAGYKKVLYLGCVFDLVYSIQMALTGHFSGVVNEYYYVINIGILGNVSGFPTLITYSLELFCIYGNVSNLAGQFLYRYFLLCRWVFQFLNCCKRYNCSNRRLNLKQFNCMVFIGFIPTFVYIGLLLRYTISTPNVPDWTLKSLTREAGFDETDPNIYTRPMGPIKDIAGAMVAVCFGFYVIVIGCIIAVYVKLKELKLQMSKTLQNVHNQVTIVLCYEAVVPIFSVILPVFVDIAHIFDIDMYTFKFFVEIARVFVSAFTPLLTIVTVKSYRHCIVNMFSPSTKVHSVVVTRELPR